MGVFSRTMLMLTLVWLAGLIVLFMTKAVSNEPDWRDRFVAEANIRRAIAYRHVGIKGGLVPERGIPKTDSSDERKEYKTTQESLNAPPYSFDGGTSSAFTGGPDKIPGSKISAARSLINMEKVKGQEGQDKISADKVKVKGEIDALRTDIGNALRDRNASDARLAEVRENIRLFAAQMASYQYIISSFQALAFNIDYEIHRAIIERDSLLTELAQIESDTARIGVQQAALEDAYYKISKLYEKTIKVLAWYEQAAPNLRQLAESTGRGWLRGQVIGVGDDARMGIVSISLGSNEGVKENQVFTIFRNDKFVARMIVENVRANVAMGRVLPEFRGKVIVLANDSVKTAVPLKRSR